MTVKLLKFFHNSKPLQNRAEQSGERLFQFLYERAVTPVRDGDAGAVFQVVEEYFFHPLVEFLAVDKYVALEIVFHAPEVEVG